MKRRAAADSALFREGIRHELGNADSRLTIHYPLSAIRLSAIRYPLSAIRYPSFTVSSRALANDVFGQDWMRHMKAVSVKLSQSRAGAFFRRARGV